MFQSTSGSSPARLVASIFGNDVFKNLILRAARGALSAMAGLALLTLSGFSAPATAQTPSMLEEPATQVSAGGGHTCALTTVGGVKCWGVNNNGQLGNPTNLNTNNDNPTALPVVGLTGVVAISLGGLYTCALTAAGGVKCWGDNLYGQLGDNSTLQRNAPVDVTGLTSGVAAISSGGSHTCALTTAGAVKCWGNGAYGQVGNNSNTSSSIPVNVTSLGSGVTAVSAGASHTCALTTAGGMKCWGANVYGQLGNSSTTNSAIPVAVTNLGNGVAAIGAGEIHSCALTTVGGVKCWGGNSLSQLGDNSTTQQLIPVDVSGLASGVASISTSAYHTCSLTTAGAMKCWGFNNNGQLGDNTSNNRSTPVNVSGLGSGVTAISVGQLHTCALGTVGGVKCWGDNSYGKLGNNSATPQRTPMHVNGFVSGATAISAGERHTCAVTSSGGVTCWGNNAYGQLGDNSTNSRLTPAAVSGLDTVYTLSAGGYFNCVLTTSFAIKCWGLNGNGQLGDGTTTTRLTPVEIPSLNGQAFTVNAGNAHACALIGFNAVTCWGNNINGQIGDNSTTNRLTPVSSAAGDFALQISGGGLHTCDIVNGGVRCWGYNASGQLGDSTTTQRLTPVNVLGIASGATGVAAGLFHTCAVMAGAAKCWGQNFYGTLGNNSTTNSLSAVDVYGLANGTAAIRTGLLHTCALTTGGGVKCWGYNGNGQVGDGTSTNRLTAADATGLGSGVTAITAGINHTCAVTSAGLLKCWGSNAYGQLGDNSTVDRLAPVDIRRGQSISFAPPATAVSGSTLTLTASASSALTPVTFDTWTPTTCTITGGSTLNLIGAPGTLCGVRASQSGAAPLPAGGSVAPAPQQLRLIQIPLTVSSTSLSSNVNPSTVGTSVTLTSQVTGSLSPLPTGTITFADGAATLGTITLNGSASASYSTAALAGGNHNLTATYSGDVRNAMSAGALTQVVNKFDQVIVFGSAPIIVVGSTGTVSATGGASGNPVTFSNTTTSICQLSGTSVKGLAVGTCIIAADQSGDATYNDAAQQTQSFNVKAPQPVLDIDNSAPTTQYDAATDGVLLIRYLLGYRGGALTTGAISGSAQRNATQIAAHIAANLTLFDVDGDGQTSATTDGVMILRRLLGITNAAAITQGVKNSNRTDADVVLAIDALKP